MIKESGVELWAMSRQDLESRTKVCTHFVWLIDGV